MFEDNKSHLAGLASDVKDYAGLRAEELKDKAGKTLSVALSQVLSWFLIIVVLAIALSLLAYALLQWLNGLLGAPWGTLIVLGFYLVIFILLLVFRKKMFRNVFSNILTGLPADALDERIAVIDDDVQKQEQRVDKSFKRFRKDLAPANLAVGLFRNSVGKAGWASILLSLLTRRKKKR